MHDKVQIAISACLLGHRVRYDAKILPILDQNPILRQLNIKPDNVEFIPFCPEVSIGLPVPRAKIQLISNKNHQIRVLGVEDHTLDVTKQLESYAQGFMARYPDINIYVVKSKSPSCGYQSTPIFTPSQEQIDLSSGLFVQTILKKNPQLLIIDI